MALDTGFFSGSANNDLTGAINRARVGGSSFTVFTWQSQPITFARQISHQSPAAVGPTTPIHPLDSPYPIDLITPMALTMGTITLELYELYGANVWERLEGLGRGSTSSGAAPANTGIGSPVDLAGIFRSVANSNDPIHINRIIRPPKIRGKTMKSYTEEFHNCVVSSLTDGETIEIGTMEVLKQITVNYTHITRGGFNGLLAKSSSLGPPTSISNDPGSQFR